MEVLVADDIKTALIVANCWQTFEKLPPSHKKEYLRWVEAAKQPATRTRRIQKMCRMLASAK